MWAKTARKDMDIAWSVIPKVCSIRYHGPNANEAKLRAVVPVLEFKEQVMKPSQPRHLIADMKAIVPVPCPCGHSRRAFAEDPQQLASFHIVKIHQDSHLHFHLRQTEIYYVLEGTGHVEVDGESIPVSPGIAVMIKPGCRHRAVGDLTIINMVTPAFDATDEYIVE